MHVFFVLFSIGCSRRIASALAINPSCTVTSLPQAYSPWTGVSKTPGGMGVPLLSTPSGCLTPFPSSDSGTGGDTRSQAKSKRLSQTKKVTRTLRLQKVTRKVCRTECITTLTPEMTEICRICSENWGNIREYGQDKDKIKSGTFTKSRILGKYETRLN